MPSNTVYVPNPQYKDVFPFTVLSSVLRRKFGSGTYSFGGAVTALVNNRELKKDGTVTTTRKEKTVPAITQEILDYVYNNKSEFAWSRYISTKEEAEDFYRKQIEAVQITQESTDSMVSWEEALAKAQKGERVQLPTKSTSTSSSVNTGSSDGSSSKK